MNSSDFLTAYEYAQIIRAMFGKAKKKKMYAND